jgi:hypothetical protein
MPPLCAHVGVDGGAAASAWCCCLRRRSLASAKSDKCGMGPSQNAPGHTMLGCCKGEILTEPRICVALTPDVTPDFWQ